MGARIKRLPGKPGPYRPLEREVQQALLDYLQNVLGWLAWRNNSGCVTATYKGKQRFFRFNSAVGGSDIFFVAPDGKFGSVEAKREGGKPTEKQQAWLEAVRATNGIAICATSLDELISALADLGYIVRSQ